MAGIGNRGRRTTNLSDRTQTEDCQATHGGLATVEIRRSRTLRARSRPPTGHPSRSVHGSASATGPVSTA